LNELKRIAPDDAAQICVRLRFAAVFGMQFIAGLQPELKADNLKFIERAEVEYQEISPTILTEDQRGYAERGLEAFKVFRQCS
jgi:hypothetical protein